MISLRTTPFRRPAVLALLLLGMLFAQVGAQAHVYSHLKTDTGSPHSGATSGQTCSECLASASLHV